MRQVLFLGLFFALLTLPGLALAQEEMKMILPIDVLDAYAYPTADDAKESAVFLTLKSHKAEDDRLIKAVALVSDTTKIYSDTAKEDAIELPANEQVVLKPHGPYIMFTDLTIPLSSGDAFPLTLTFEKEGDIEVMVNVRPQTENNTANEQ